MLIVEIKFSPHQESTFSKRIPLEGAIDSNHHFFASQSFINDSIACINVSKVGS